MKVLVTGADGMLGSHICRALLARGDYVRALVQPSRETGTLSGLDLEKHEGDICSNQDLIKSLDSCEAVIHTAATTQIWPSRSPSIWQVNYGGTRLLAEAALEQGVNKFIHIGTSNSFGPGSKENPGTEENAYTDHKYKLDYLDSKRAAQDYLLDLVKTVRFPVSVINPSFMFGAYDSKPGSGVMIQSVYHRKTPGYARGGRSFVAAKDVATCAVNALSQGKTGECYLAAGENLNYQEVFRLIAWVVGVDPPKLPIPNVMIDIFGLFGSLWGAVSKRTPLLSYQMARIAHADCYYSNTKAVRELGMPQTSLEEAV